MTPGPWEGAGSWQGSAEPHPGHLPFQKGWVQEPEPTFRQPSLRRDTAPRLLGGCCFKPGSEVLVRGWRERRLLAMQKAPTGDGSSWGKALSCCCK